MVMYSVAIYILFYFFIGQVHQKYISIIISGGYFFKWDIQFTMLLLQVICLIHKMLIIVVRIISYK